MVTEDIWRQADGLMKRALAATSGINLPADDNWHIVVAVNLYQAYERLVSIFMLCGEGISRQRRCSHEVTFRGRCKSVVYRQRR